MTTTISEKQRQVPYTSVLTSPCRDIFFPDPSSPSPYSRLNLISHNRTKYNNTNNIHEVVGQKTKYDELVDYVLVLASIGEFLYHYNRPKVRRYGTVPVQFSQSPSQKKDLPYLFAEVLKLLNVVTKKNLNFSEHFICDWIESRTVCFGTISSSRSTVHNLIRP